MSWEEAGGQPRRCTHPGCGRATKPGAAYCCGACGSTRGFGDPEGRHTPMCDGRAQDRAQAWDREFW